MKNTHEFLHHLKNAVPNKGYGNRLSMYLISLEAWRRGLTVKFFLKDNPDNKLLIRYSIGDEKAEYEFESSLGEKLSSYAYEICNNKDETKNVLFQAGLPVPKGKRFTADIKNNEINDYANELGFPLVIKPISENAGRGVFSNIKNISEFKEALIHVREKLAYQDLIVERHIDGIEHRIFLVDGKVLAVTNRIPANIKGDGISTIEELIELKNKSKQTNPSVANKLIEQDKEVNDAIRSLGYSYQSIPKAGELIYLRQKSNVSAGGDAVDVTNQLTPQLKKIAEDATRAIEGLNVCGLDMIIDKESNTGVIIEINTKPMIGLHVFPNKGEPRDVVSPIIDYYFPATKGKKKSKLYFDFDSVIAPLRDRSVTEIKLSSPPSLNHLFAKRFTINGIFDSEFEKEVRLLALKQRIHGYLKETSARKFELVISSGNNKVINKFINQVKLLKSVSELNVVEYEYNLPIKIGFEVYKISGNQKRLNRQQDRIRNLRDELKVQRRVNRNYKKEVFEDRRQNSILGKRILELDKQNKKYIKRNTKLIQEHAELLNEHQKILDSISWKITKQVRKIGKVIKRN